jgi:uncharacterized protein
MRTKDFIARVKAAGIEDGLAEGQFVALVSVFGNEDSMGDVVRPGAFTESLAEWAAKGDPIPVIWSHAWGDPFAHIGTVVKAVETLQGLEITGQIDDMADNPTSAQVYRLLKGRRVTQFSFAYDVLEDAWVEDHSRQWGGYLELRKLKLHEVGPCLVGANQETELLAAKARGLADGAKAGRVLSQSNFATLKGAYDSIGEVLNSATPEKAKTASAPAGTQEAEETETVQSTIEEPGQPGVAAADGEEPSAQPADTTPAKGTGWTTEDELMARVADLVSAELAKVAKAADPAGPETNDTTTPSSTENETTPDLREVPDEGAAKADDASLRWRTDLELMELEASLTE